MNIKNIINWDAVDINIDNIIIELIDAEIGVGKYIIDRPGKEWTNYTGEKGLYGLSPKITENTMRMSLRMSTTKKQVETVLSSYNEYFGTKEKIEVLRSLMGISEIHSVSNKTSSLKKELEYEIEMFVEGSWRLYV